MKPSPINTLIFNITTVYNTTDEYAKEDIFNALLASMFHYEVWVYFTYHAYDELLIRMKKACYISNTFQDMMKEIKDDIVDMGALKIQYFYFDKVLGSPETFTGFREYVSGSGSIVYVEEIDEY